MEKVVIPQLHTIFIALHDADRFSQPRSSFNVFGVGYRSPKLILTAILTFDFDQPHRTARAVTEKLKRFGCDEVIPGIGRTGVFADICGRKPGSKVVTHRNLSDRSAIVQATQRRNATRRGQSGVSA